MHLKRHPYKVIFGRVRAKHSARSLKVFICNFCLSSNTSLSGLGTSFFPRVCHLWIRCMIKHMVLNIIMFWNTKINSQCFACSVFHLLLISAVYFHKINFEIHESKHESKWMFAFLCYLPTGQVDFNCNFQTILYSLATNQSATVIPLINWTNAIQKPELP